MDDELVPGCYVKCKFLGVLETEDEQGIDPKIIMCPCKKVDPKYKNLNTVSDLPDSTREKIYYFFTHYKDLENKYVQVGEWFDKDEAIQIYHASIVN